MDTSIFTSPGFETAFLTIASIAAFLSALLLSSAIRMNKGAKSNVAWVSIALGLILVGVSEAGAALSRAGFSLLERWGDFLMTAGLLCILLGVVLWRRLVKKALD